MKRPKELAALSAEETIVDALLTMLGETPERTAEEVSFCLREKGYLECPYRPDKARAEAPGSGAGADEQKDVA